MVQRVDNATLQERWLAARPTKTVMFWSCLGCVVVTMAVGFTWGGWVRGATAHNMAAAAAEDAVVRQLAGICVAQFKRDPASERELKALKDLSAYERGDYVKKRGWATMPGVAEVDSKVAAECARLVAPPDGSA